MEPTLAITKDDLESEVGEFMGWGRGPNRGGAEWSDRKVGEIKAIVKSGLRCFYDPETDGNGPPHSWSFLRPTESLTLLDGDSTVTLPDDFGSLEGNVTIGSDGGTRWALAVTGEGRIRERHTVNPDTTGVPEMIAVRPIKGTTANRGQRFELYVWPIADQDYMLGLTYNLQLNALTDDRPYPYGGAGHAETILEACLAVAEVRKDGRVGEHTLRFQRRMTASIAKDRRNKPAHFGYNADRSDGIEWRKGPREVVTVTLAGLTPDSGIQ